MSDSKHGETQRRSTAERNLMANTAGTRTVMDGQGAWALQEAAQ